MATVEAQIYYPRTFYYIWENVASVTGINYVQAVIHHHSKVFTTDQAMGNPKHYIIKCVGGR